MPKKKAAQKQKRLKPPTWVTLPINQWDRYTINSTFEREYLTEVRKSSTEPDPVKYAEEVLIMAAPQKKKFNYLLKNDNEFTCRYK